MESRSNTENDVEIKIQDTLIAINDITLKIRKELELIEELVKENGHLHMTVNAANETLSKKVQEMGMNVEHIMNKSKGRSRSEPDLLNTIIPSDVTERLSNEMGTSNM